MSDESDCERCRALLPEFAAGTLAAQVHDEVERHLVGCSSCAAELAKWTALAEVVRAEDQRAVPPVAFEASWEQVATRIAQLPPLAGTQAAAPAARSIWAGSVAARTNVMLAAGVALSRHAAAVLAGQARLLRPAVWIASAAGIALAVLYALALPRLVGERDVLAFALPLIAATGVAFLYGPDVDAGLEMALATPTSPRTVLLGRFALLFGYDTALALAGTLALALAHHDGFGALVSVWFGPMALLATLSLALSLVLGPAVAIGGAAALWLSRALRFQGGVTLQVSASAFWVTTPQILALALALLAAALIYVPRQQHLRPDSDG